MRIEDFTLLTRKDQLDLIYNDGVYIGKQKKGKHVRVLYQIYVFYVEIYYTKYRTNISAIRYIRTVEGIEPYLEQINVDVLVNI